MANGWPGVHQACIQEDYCMLDSEMNEAELDEQLARKWCFCADAGQGLIL